MKTGHRIIITYNLYVTEHIGGVIQRFPTADAALSPLYEGAKQILEQPGFMKNGKILTSFLQVFANKIQGGTLSFYSARQYAHVRNDSTGSSCPTPSKEST